MEEYLDSTIVYGQGNMLFDSKSAGDMETWQTSLLVEVLVSEEGFKVEYIPIEKQGEFTSLSKNTEIMGGFLARSREILENGFIKRNYTEFVMSNPQVFESYLTHLSNGDKLGTKHGAGTRNLLTCDPHREFIVTYVEGLHELYKND